MFKAILAIYFWKIFLFQDFRICLNQKKILPKPPLLGNGYMPMMTTEEVR